MSNTKNRESIKAAINLVENEYCVVIHACEVDKFKKNKEKCDHRFLLLTNIGVNFFKIASRPKQSNSEYWANLVGIKGLLSDDNLMTLYFKLDNYKFKVDDLQEMKAIRLKLGDLFQRIYTPEQLEMRGFCKTDLYQISCHSIPNSFGEYSRYISYAKANNVEIDKITEKRFFKYLSYHQRAITFPKMIKPSEFESFAYGIDALTYVESITFDKLSNMDIFQQLNIFFTTLFDNPSSYMNKNKDQLKNDENKIHFGVRENIRHFRFKKIKITKHFDEFMQGLTNGQIQHNLTSLSFDKMKLAENDFYLIEKVCKSINSNKNVNFKLKSLSFNSSLKEDFYNYFISSFLNNDTTRHLVLLSLNKTKGLTMPLLLDKIRNITSLSLEDCEINILSTLQCIDRTRMKNLRLLNLSGNYCSKSDPLNFESNRNKSSKRKKDSKNNLDAYNPNDDAEFEPDDIVFPPSLTVLYVRNVRWGLRYRSLIALLTKAASFRPKTKANNREFHLSIRGIRGGSFCSDDDDDDDEFINSNSHFNELNSYLADFFINVKKSNITHLDWAGNPVSYEFLYFLSKSKNLVELDVSCCFSAELEESYEKSKDSDTLLKHFSQYLIKEAKNLESLIICGNTKWMNNVENKKKSEKDTLSQNLSGNSISPLFQAIKVTKNPLKYVNISGQKLNNPHGLDEFSDAIGANVNIQKVSFKNTGFNTAQQFNYFASKVQKRTLLVEWPSKEMKQIQVKNISFYRKLLIDLSRINFYYEEDPNESGKVQSKQRKSLENTEINPDEEEAADYPDIKFERLVFGKNYMARNIETFAFDTEKKFPTYFSKELKEFLALHPVGDELKKKKKKKHKKKNDSDEEEEEEKKKSSKKDKVKEKDVVIKNDKPEEESKSESDKDKDDEEEDEEEEDKVDDSKKKKESLVKKDSKKKKVPKPKKEEEEEEEEEEDRVDASKKKKPSLVKKNSKKKKVPKPEEDDDDESEEEEESDKKNKKSSSKKKSSKKRVPVPSESESESEAIVKNKNKPSNDDSDDESENDDDDEKWEFPTGIRPKESNAKSIKKIKEKYTFENLMLNLVNGSD